MVHLWPTFSRLTRSVVGQCNGCFGTREYGARRKSLADAEVAVLVERYEAGLTIREIAAEQGFPRRRCRMRWHELGLR